MKKYIVLVGMILWACSGVVHAQEPPKKPSILIAYFTRADNISLAGNVDTTTHASVKPINGEYKGDTEIIAEWIQHEIGGDLFSIQTVNPYSADYNESVDQGGIEKRKNVHPPLTTRVQNMADYDIVFLGYPMWWRDVPMAVYTFLDTYDLAGKTLVPFSTHMGGGLGESLKTLHKLEPDATMLEALLISDYSLLQDEQKVENWLAELGF